MQSFFLQEAPSLVKNLTSDTQPLWGSMTANEMLVHVRLGLLASLKLKSGKLSIPAEVVPKAKQFLMSDKPLPKGVPQPFFYKIDDHLDTFENNIEKLISALQYFNAQTMEVEDFQSFHPSFGEMDRTETRQLHYKHIRHHFTQFGLIKED